MLLASCQDKDYVSKNDNLYRGVSREWLIQSVKDTCLYTRWDVTDDSAWFNSSIGDTLHFDYIRKDRFFKIHNRRAAPSHEGLSGLLYTIATDTTIDSAFIYKGGIQVMYRNKK